MKQKGPMASYSSYWQKLCCAIVDILHEIAGVPNYQRYLQHFAQNHPGETPWSEKEFHRRATDEKYGGATMRRCC